MSSEAQITANRHNAQASIGPKTEAGKAKSSLNAVKTALTGRTVLLPTDDAALYEAHLAAFRDRFEPIGPAETDLVQSLADTQWRLLRIPALEMGIYALGRLEFAELFPQEDPAVRAGLIEAKTFLTYQCKLNNLSIQETRLRRQFEKDTAGLRELQDARKRSRQASLDHAARDYIVAVVRAIARVVDRDGLQDRLIGEREPVYAQADIHIRSRDVAHDDVVDDILSALDRYLDGGTFGD